MQYCILYRFNCAVINAIKLRDYMILIVKIVSF